MNVHISGLIDIVLEHGSICGETALPGDRFLVRRRRARAVQPARVIVWDRNRWLVVIPMVKGWRYELERVYGWVMMVVEMGSWAAAKSLLARADRGDGRDGRVC